MTTKPKARKFRIARRAVPRLTRGGRHGPAGPRAQRQPPKATQPHRPAAQRLTHRPPEPAATEDGFSNAPFPGSAAFDKLQAEAADAATDNAPKADAPKADDTPPEPQEPNAGMPTAEQELAAIRAEGLTGRQLRMARRIAQKHGLAPSSDFDAVRLLRQRGVDPFARGGKLELVVDMGPQAAAGAAAQAGGAVQSSANSLPAMPRTTQPAAPQPTMPQPGGAPQPISADDRAAEIMKVQRDIARRRRKRLVLLATRLTFFVLLPTFLVSFYFYRVATPMYATHSRIHHPEGRKRRWRRWRRSRRSSGRLGLCHGAGKHHGAGLPRKPRGDAAPR
jgi:capsular polysaccharide transport system permease protein